MKRKYTKLELPRQVYRYTDSETRITDEQETFTPVLKLEWNKGIFLHLEGAEYPQKTMASPQVLWALGHSKRFLIESLRFLSKWYFVPSFLIIAILPWKKKVRIVEQFLQSFVQISWRPISPYMMKNEYLTPVAQEMEWGVYSFLDNLGIRPDICRKFSEVVGAFVEYDSAYRYRTEDIFSETTKTKLVDNPSKEIKRLSKIMFDRDIDSVATKLRVVTRLIEIVLIHPKVKKALKVAISEMDIRKMGLDEADRYWVCFRHDYNFMGKTYEERKEMVKDRKKPLLVPIDKATK